MRRVRGFEEVRAHRHDAYQVVAPLNGELRLELVDGTALQVSPPTLALVGPQVDHRAVAAATLDLFDVLLPVGLLEAAAQRLELPLLAEGAKLVAIEQPGPLLRELVFTLATPSTRVFLDETARYFAAALVERMAQGGAVLDAAQYKSVIVQRAVAWIHAHPDAPLHADDLARRVGASTRTLTRRFREEVGEPLAAYVTAARMRRAGERLLSADVSVEAVAAEVGYASTSHFHRAFRRHHGVTPQALRARARLG